MQGPESRFLNRELSWLEFNQRVLDEALDPATPLLDRLNFLAITASNLDEFFMVRVGGLQMLVSEGVRKPDPAGLTPSAQLERIAERVGRMVADQYALYRATLRPALEQAGLRRVTPETLTPEQDAYLRDYFAEEVFPVVSPVAVTEDGFPRLANRRLHVAVRMKAAPGGSPRLAVIPLSRHMKRFVTVPSAGGYAFVLLEDLVALYAGRLFPGLRVIEAAAFRVTRNADIAVQEDKASDFLALMEDVLEQRRAGACVRLEVAAACSRALRAQLARGACVRPAQVFAVDGPLDLAVFTQLASIEGFEALRYPAWTPQAVVAADRGKSIFAEIAQRDILLSHPYESFDPVIRLVEEAAGDPDVLAIKQILYRTSANSPIVEALKAAAARGKYVTAVVELKARFDEARNIEWAGELENAGVQVIYGVRGLKTHAKLCLVVRREGNTVVRYVHTGTGNYNERTARLYSDVGLLTRHPDLGGDAAAFFHMVTGYSEPQALRKLSAAPLGLRERLLELVEAERARAERGGGARIRAKMNSLVCPRMIDALCRASQAGVKVELNVRGICCLRPGVKGVSDNVRVISIVDRFLEHARIVEFGNDGEPLLFISSADWMPRNLDRRVELLVPVEDDACRRRLMAQLDVYFADTVKGRWLRPNGQYEKRPGPAGRPPVRSQMALCDQAVAEAKAARQAQRSVIEPIYPPGRAAGNA